MKRFRYLLGCLLLSFVGLAQAQIKPSTILARAQKAVYGSAECLLVHFSSDLQASTRLDNQSVSGRIYLQGEAFRLEFGSTTAVFSSGTLYAYNQDEQTLTITTPTDEELVQINPMHFLRSYSRSFLLSSLPESKRAHILGFTPKTKSEIRRIELSIDRKTYLPIDAVVIGRDESCLTLTLGEIKRLKRQPDGFFRLASEQYPGCEVVDLR